ncbi:nitroreductase [Aliikangiella marina]|uniref:Putative NAD(P)H nitroreductase n=2 Tax=Aliikangiella marina TaxID=1712262 RepID=A0A545TK25_9GAMM|nr:nitroreductase [Aliikangiella marina]
MLLSRKSHNKLVAPAPIDEQLEVMFRAALRAPDHALLKPWRYRVFEGEALHELATHMVTAAAHDDPEISEDKLAKLKTKPFRAPMVIVASVVIQEHPKVPEIEQILSGGASVQNLLMAAHFQGVGAMWRTGSLAFSQKMMDLLGFEDKETLIGFVYLGTEEGDKRQARISEIEEHVTRI